MKFLILSLPFLVMSCGRVETGSGSSSFVGQEKLLAPVALSAAEKNELEPICAAIAQKSTQLSQANQPGFTFSVVRRNCNETSFGAASDVPVVVQTSSGKAQFKLQGGGDFVFNDVETTGYGLVGEICARLNVGTPTNPMVLNSGAAVWFTTSGSNCIGNTQGKCIQVQTGVASGSVKYKITESNTYKFQINSNLANYGYFVERSVVSSNGCDANKSYEVRATLK